MYRVVDAVLVRAALHPAGMDLPAWPDLTGSTDEHVRQWRSWLDQVWSRDSLAEAIEVASPVLAREAGKVLSGHVPEPRQMRRIVMSVARYVLRAADRATPFGLFAGVTPAAFGSRPAVRWGEDHHTVTQLAAGRLAAVVTSLEACPELLRRLPVISSNLCTIQGGRLVAASQQHIGPGDGDTSQAAPVEVSVRRTRAAEAALRYARSPIVVRDLAAKLAAGFPGTPQPVIEKMLAELVRLRLLLTSLRPPMTVTDPLAHVLAQLDAAGAASIPRIAGQVRELRTIGAETRRHDQAPSPGERRYHRARLAGQMQRPVGITDPPVTVDMRLDAEIVLPAAVAREAEAAAAALTRLTPHPSGLPAWQDYHAAFIERYGLGALIPLLEITSPGTGLGFPATFRGSARTLPAPPLPTRDERLLALAYATVISGGGEILLDDQTISDLAGDGELTQIPPHAELFVQVHAASMAAAGRGEFTLVVTGASRAAGTTTGRFLHLLETADQDRISRTYAGLSTVRAGALPAQVSCPPVYARSEGVARAPAVFPTVISAAEYHEPDPRVLPLDDLAVGGDADGLYLVSLAGQRIVEPAALNAVEFRNFSHPLARFLCEITRARAAVYMPFSWGAASPLPFLPRLRYRRTVLAPARWNLPASDLPGAAAPWQQWKDGMAGWRKQFRVPAAVYLGEADNLLRLDLDQDTPLALLRSHLDRRGHATLYEAPGLDSYGWLDSRAHEICIPLTSTMPTLAAPAPARLARSRVVGRDHGHLPGCSPWLYVKLYGHPGHQDSILARVPDLLAAFEDPPPWWYVRYLDPEPHLRLRLRLPGAGAYGQAAHHVGAWAATLRDAGLAGRIQFDTYYPETGRYGSGAAMAAAEAVFAADSAAAIAQAACAASGSTHPHALTAVSLSDIAAAFTGGIAAGMRWLVSHIPKGSSAAPVPRPVHDQAMRLADPRDDHAALHAVPGGDQVRTAWRRRALALAAYRDTLLPGAGETSADSVLASLLHMHHIRVAGPGLETEQACHRLARSAAVGWLARNEATRP
ncbi:MAG TPA: lantibiotic dehydratase [Streptosporangiaceae bacterium]|nr:lantibiotic dehydratase [Streptosporangiaceae bacterium]